VLDHFMEELNGGPDGGLLMPDGTRQPIRIMLLAGGDLIQSFAVPNLWKEVIAFNQGRPPPHPGRLWVSDCGTHRRKCS
jgi:hypothetical protein